MADKLKACPFCSGEVRAVVKMEHALWIEHVARGCLVFDDGVWASEYEWNTRRAPEEPTEAMPWWEKAIRDHCAEHGPSGAAWNISMVLYRLRKAAV